MSIPETPLTQLVLDGLRQILPECWKMKALRPRNGRGVPDLLVELHTPDGCRAVLVIETKGSIEPRDIPGIAERIQQRASSTDDGAAMVAAPFISPRSRAALSARGVGYWDVTGNAHLALDQPALFIRTDGADRNPRPDSRPLRSLRGPAAGRVVRALCDFLPPYGVRELAERAGVSPASLSRTIELLGREGIVKRSSTRGPVAAVDWSALIRRWTDDYAFSTSNRMTSYLEPRGLETFKGRLSEQALDYSVTGSLAAAAIGATASAPRLAVLFVRERVAAADVLKLRAAESGANVLLAEPFDPVAFERTRRIDGITYAAPSQIASDLLTGPGRSPADGEALLGWMEENEDAWRA